MPDNPRRDLLQNHLYTAGEKDCAYSVLFTPGGETLLRAWAQQVLTNPIPLDQLQTSLCNAMPALQQYYNQHPHAPPLFHVNETLQRLQQLRNAHGNGVVDVVWLQLMCIKYDDPFGPLAPNAPPGPTTEFCLELDAFLKTRNTVLHVSETARMCMHYFLEGYGQRRGLFQDAKPDAFMYEIMGLLVLVEYVCLIKQHNCRIRSIKLMGAWAMKIAQLVDVDTRSIKLTPRDVHSSLFGATASIGHHPRVQLGSKFIELRSLASLREVLGLWLDMPHPHLRARYTQRCASFNRTFEPLDTLERDLGIDLSLETPANVEHAYRTVSQRLQHLVSVQGTGTHGRRFGNTGIYGGGIDKGICSTPGGTAEGEKAIAMASIDGELRPATLQEILASNDTGEMYECLALVGFEVPESATEADIATRFKRAMPVLRLYELVTSLLARFRTQGDVAETEDGLTNQTDDIEEIEFLLEESLPYLASAEVQSLTHILTTPYLDTKDLLNRLLQEWRAMEDQPVPDMPPASATSLAASPTERFAGRPENAIAQADSGSSRQSNPGAQFGGPTPENSPPIAPTPMNPPPIAPNALALPRSLPNLPVIYSGPIDPEPVLLGTTLPPPGDELQIRGIWCDYPTAPLGLRDETIRKLVGDFLGPDWLPGVRSVRILRWEKPSSASLHPVIFGVSLFKPDSCMNVIRLRASSIKAAHTMWTTDSILELEKRNKIRLYDGPLIALVGSEPPPLEPDEYSLVDASEITCPDDTYGTSEVALRARISLLVSPNLVDDIKSARVIRERCDSPTPHDVITVRVRMSTTHLEALREREKQGEIEKARCTRVHLAW